MPFFQPYQSPHWAEKTSVKSRDTSAELVVAARTASHESPERVHQGLRNHLAWAVILVAVLATWTTQVSFFFPVILHVITYMYVGKERFQIKTLSKSPSPKKQLNWGTVLWSRFFGWETVAKSRCPSFIYKKDISKALGSTCYAGWRPQSSLWGQAEACAVTDVCLFFFFGPKIAL